MFPSRAAARWFVAIVIVSSALGVQVTGASAARRHRHRRHHHISPPVVDPGLAGPVVLSPNPVVMNVDGAWAASMSGGGLPAGMPLTIDDSSLVGHGCQASTPPPPPPGDDRAAKPLAGIDFAPTEVKPHVVTDATPTIDGGGHFSVGLACPGPSIPGTYPIFVTEDQSPFQTFTVFITLTFA